MHGCMQQCQDCEEKDSSKNILSQGEMDNTVATDCGWTQCPCFEARFIWNVLYKWMGLLDDPGYPPLRTSILSSIYAGLPQLGKVLQNTDHFMIPDSLYNRDNMCRKGKKCSSKLTNTISQPGTIIMSLRNHHRTPTSALLSPKITPAQTQNN